MLTIRGAGPDNNYYTHTDKSTSLARAREPLVSLHSVGRSWRSLLQPPRQDSHQAYRPSEAGAGGDGDEARGQGGERGVEREAGAGTWPSK